MTSWVKNQKLEGLTGQCHYLQTRSSGKQQRQMTVSTSTCLCYKVPKTSWEAYELKCYFALIFFYCDFTNGVRLFLTSEVALYSRSLAFSSVSATCDLRDCLCSDDLRDGPLAAGRRSSTLAARRDEFRWRVGVRSCCSLPASPRFGDNTLLEFSSTALRFSVSRCSAGLVDEETNEGKKNP